MTGPDAEDAEEAAVDEGGAAVLVPVVPPWEPRPVSPQRIRPGGACHGPAGMGEDGNIRTKGNSR